MKFLIGLDVMLGSWLAVICIEMLLDPRFADEYVWTAVAGGASMGFFASAIIAAIWIDR